jgi:hypothetical protein
MKQYPSIVLTLAMLWIGAAAAHAQRELATGFLKREVFANLPGTTVEELTASQKFIDNQPDAVSMLGSFEAPVDAANDYGQRLSGLLVPPTTGTYVFFIASDDASELWLSSDLTPAKKQLIASVSGWTASREWNKFPDTQNNSAAPVKLVAGTPYYIEALMKEGGGGDNLAVGWILPGQYVDPANAPDGLTNITVIPGSALGGYVEKGNSRVTIATQPTNVTSFTTMRAVFTVVAMGASDLGTTVFYQWKRNGQDILGATASSYITPELTLADHGARFTCAVSVPGATQTTQEATLTVLDAAAPRLQIDRLAPAGTNVAVWWSSPDPGFYLQGSAALTPPAWAPATQAVSYEGMATRVTMPAVSSRFFRLNHGKVVLESLWAESMTPAGGAATQADSELGTIFTASAPGFIRAIRFYVMPGESGIHVARLWRNRDNKLVGGPYEIAIAGYEGWFVHYLPTPVAVEAETGYTVAVSTGQDPARTYASSPNVLLAPGGNGRSLRYPASAGVFTTQIGARPSQSTNASVYFRDVLFLPTEIPAENLIAWDLDRPVSFGRGGDGNGYELGTVFRSSVRGTITGIRVFATSAESGVHTAQIWRNAGDLIVGGPYEFTCGAGGGLGASAWFLYSLNEPVPIEPNTDYTVSVTTGTDSSLAYAYINGALAFGGDNARHLSYPAAAGVAGPVGSRPTQTTLDTNINSTFLRDVVFQPEGSTESEDVMGGGTVYAARKNAAHELGTVFQASAAGTIKGIRVYAVSAESGAHTARIWRNKDDAVVGGPYPLTYGGTNGWLTFDLPAPVAVESNVLYTVSVSTGEDAGKAHAFVPDGFATAGGNSKNLSYPALAGVFTASAGTRPTQTANAESYMRDIVFQPAVTKARATMGNTTDGTFADYITDATSAYINANRFRAPANMTVTSIKAKVDSIPGHYKCALYADKAGMADGLLMASQERTKPATGWNEFPLTAPVNLRSGTYYWIAIWSDDVNARVYYTSQTGGLLKWIASPYGDWPNPVALDPNGSQYLYCLYAEGTFDE